MMFQGGDFSVADVAGRVLEKLLGIFYDLEEEGGTSGRPDCFLLKVRGLPWQRFFFDAGIVFWGEYELEELEEDLESRSIDYVQTYLLDGRTVESAVCEDREDLPGTLNVTISLDDGTDFVAYVVDPADLDSEVDIKVIKRVPRDVSPA